MAKHAHTVKGLRQARVWSQEDLASISDISVRTIQRIEAGKSASHESLKALANAFEVDVQSLLGKKSPGRESEAEELPREIHLPPSDLDRDLVEAEFEMKRLDALSENKPDHQKAQTRLQKQIILQGLVKRFREARLPARAWELQRRIDRIRQEGKVATASQKKFDKIVDIDAERDAFREDSRRKHGT